MLTATQLFQRAKKVPAMVVCSFPVFATLCDVTYLRVVIVSHDPSTTRCMRLQEVFMEQSLPNDQVEVQRTLSSHPDEQLHNRIWSLLGSQ
jgi:hypothetical protein